MVLHATVARNLCSIIAGKKFSFSYALPFYPCSIGWSWEEPR
jgi:hypothetical protein